MTIGKKLVISFSIIILFIAGIFGLGWYGIQSVESEANNIVNDAVPLSNAANNILTALVNQETGVRGYLVTGDPTFLEPYYLGAEEITRNLEIIDAHIDGHPIMASLIEEALPKIDAVQSFFESIIREVESGNIEQARANINNGKVHFDSYRVTHALIVEDTEKLTNDAWMRVKAMSTQSEILMSVVFGLILVLSVLIILYLIKVITKPVNLISSSLKQIADGNLTIDKIQLKSKDEIGELAKSLNTMIDDLNETMLKTSESAHHVASASEQLSASAEQSTQSSEMLSRLAQDNSVGVEEQLTKINNVSKALTQLVESVNDINGNSTDMENSTNNSAEFVTNGIVSIENVVERIHEIKKSFGTMSTTINSLESKSTEIGSVVQIITDLSEQTNLLALNAAIEAARAGEQGKGFAVVADEVRKLAEESKKSAGQITAMITDIQAETQNAVGSIFEGNAKVEEGISSTTEAKSAFGKIEESITGVSHKVKEVATSIEDITGIASRISEALEEVKQIADISVSASQESSAATQEQLATMEEIASSAHSLSELAEELQMTISKFQVNGKV